MSGFILFSKSPEIKAIAEAAQTFKKLITHKQEGSLTDWLKQAKFSELKGFAKGIQRDYEAVNQAILTQFSNGQVEGQVNKLKMIKRRMYGRAGFDLLHTMTRKRLPARVKQSLFQPDAINKVWSIDYMTESLWDGRRVRLLNIVDDFSRELLILEIDTSLPALRLIRVLERLKETRGVPQMIRVDNEPEFISTKLELWCQDNKVTLAFIQPRRPMQNGYVERSNGSIRTELLNAYVWRSLSDLRIKAEEYRQDFNNCRPHDSLGDLTPAEYAKT